MELAWELIDTLILTVRDVLPIVAIVFGFQFFVIRRILQQRV